MTHVMSVMSITPSLATLPNELFYYILNHLDQETILINFGCVCKRFRSIIETYNRYKFNFQSISKSTFHILCHRIQLENIISLTLSNDEQTPGQIKIFFSKFQIQEFPRLRSLTLIKIDEIDFHTVFQSKHNLASLTFSFQEEPVINSDTFPLMSSIISSPNLRYFQFNSTSNILPDLVWPNQCLLQTLDLNICVSFHQFHTILSHSCQLKKLALTDCYTGESTDVNILGSSYPQLVSLTLYDSELNMNECELILSLLPSLEYFYIMGGIDLSDGIFWEALIKQKLLNLKTFEFALWGNTDIPIKDLTDLELLITSFRTPFWLEVKHWYVVCYYFKEMNSHSLYSLPVCKSNIDFYPNTEKVSCSTHPHWRKNTLVVDKVHEMYTNLTRLIISDNENMTSSDYPFFDKLDRLDLCIDGEWPIGSTDYLSIFINLCSIIDLSITIDSLPEYLTNSAGDLSYFLHKTCHLRSLRFYNQNHANNMENICSIVPDYVRHLRLAVEYIDDMKIIIEKLQYLDSIRFEHTCKSENLSLEFLPWLLERRRESTYRIHDRFLNIWLGRNT